MATRNAGTRSGGKAKQRARKAARTSPGRGDGALAVVEGMCREVLATQGRDVVRGGDPLQAEMWVSDLLGVFASCPLVGEDDPVAAIGGRLVSVARRARTPAAQACLRGLAVVAEGRLRTQARAALRDLARSGVQGPGWLEVVGLPEATEAWRASDLWGDQDSVMIGFRYPDDAEHSIMVLIDHVLGGVAKDATMLGPLDETVAVWRNVPDVEVVAEPVDVAAARVIAAMEMTDRTVGAPVTEDYDAATALLRSRLCPLAGAVPDVEPLGGDQRAALVREFLADPAGSRYAHDPTPWFALEALAQVPEVLKAWVPWAAERAGLPPHLATETVEAIGEAETEFAAALADEERWGPGKRLAAGMLADGLDLSDLDAASTSLDTRTA